MKRLFIAVNVTPGGELLRMISSLKALLSAEKIRWIDPSNIHLTLVFLGDTEVKRIKILKELLRERCEGFNKFDFLLAGTGVFKNYRDPRVIWTGINSAETLELIYDTITTGLKEYGFPTEERQFRPHLTIGRIKSVQDTEKLKSVLERYRDIEFQKVEVRDVILFESILLQTGPVYKPLGKFYL